MLLPALAVVLAGCAGDAPTTAFHATGSKPSFSIGWAYGGANLSAAEGTIAVDVDEASNAGKVEASIVVDGVKYEILWTNFSGAPDKPFQSGGIVANLVEHGDSNVGDPLIPRVTLLSAGWGKAQLRKDGVPVLDPATGGLWTAHYMVTETGVRAADGKIKTKAGGVYDPTKPGEGATEADREIWLVLRPGGALPPDLLMETTEPVNGPQYSKEFPLKVEAPGGSISVAFATSGPQTPVPLPAPTSDLTFTLVDANGTEVQSAKNAGELTAAAAPGDWIVRVTGTGVQATYDLTIAVDYPTSEPYVVVFEEASW